MYTLTSVGCIFAVLKWLGDGKWSVSVEINVRPRGTKYISSRIILFVFFSHIVTSHLVVVFEKMVPFCLHRLYIMSRFCYWMDPDFQFLGGRFRMSLRPDNKVVLGWDE